MKPWLPLIAVFAVAVPVAAAAEEPLSYALIVANNQSLLAQRAPLRFADDDGARYAELFGLSAEKVRLYTVLDADTQRLFPELVLQSIAPKRAEVMAGLEATFAEIREQIAAGRKVVFYFVFSGHGEVGEDGEGYVHLLDAPWTRSDLLERVVAASPATVNHIIVDACNAYFMVAQRGAQAEPAGDFAGLIRDLAGRERLARYPNTGVILSTASAAEVHEWGRVQAGIFSHELRSALAGAADANGDGAVDYDEVAAYLAAANGALPDRKTRLEVYARAPAQNLGEPLLELPARSSRLTVPATWDGRYYLEDDRGVRFADFNKTAEVSLSLHMVPRPRYYMRGQQREFVIEPAEEGRASTLIMTNARPTMLASRGAAQEAFERYLFFIPFGPQFVAGFKQAGLVVPDALAPAVVVHASPYRSWIYAAGALSGALTIGTVVMESFAHAAASEYRKGAGSASTLEARRARAESLETIAWITGTTAVVSGAAALVLYWLED